MRTSVAAASDSSQLQEAAEKRFRGDAQTLRFFRARPHHWGRCSTSSHTYTGSHSALFIALSAWVRLIAAAVAIAVTFGRVSIWVWSRRRRRQPTPDPVQQRPPLLEAPTSLALPAMTTDEILAGIDTSLAAIAAERERLSAARAELAGPPPAPTATATPRATRRRASRRQGHTFDNVLEALSTTEPRTAGDVAKLTSVTRAVAGSTLTRLVKQGKATKAERGYLRATV
jgi:hypothetical protein